MKITALSIQQKDKNRVNVFVDGAYRFSLDIYQVADLGIRKDKDYSEEELVALEQESQFGKVYARALEYCLMRPHSAKEMREYLYKKTRDTRKKDGVIKKGMSPVITERVFDRLVEKGYIDDEKFTRYWVENRNQTKGMSRRKLQAELFAKGVSSSLSALQFEYTERTDETEIQKIIQKKRRQYPDNQKFIQYLARQGFSYDTIKQAIALDDEIVN